MSLFGPNHYDYLHEHLMKFFKDVGVKYEQNEGIISAHGDKAYGYRFEWNAAEIPFNHGVSIYMLTYCKPFSDEVRETDNGWVDPGEWVRDNYERFKPFLPD